MSAMAADNSSERTIDRIQSERREKAQALRKLGRNPYRNDFQPTHSCKEVRDAYTHTKPENHEPGIHPVDGKVIRLAGRVLAKRGFGKTVFAPIRDHSGDLQLFVNVDHLREEDFTEIVPHLDAGDIVGAEGVVFWTKRGELSLLCRSFEILTKSLLPLPDKWHGLTDVELRYRQRYMDMVVNPEVREVFRKRTQIIRGIRAFLDARGFVEVETPMMHPIVGGAAARPFVTHHNALDMDLFLRIAPELYLKRLVVGGFERVYEINRNFRNEGLSRQHNPEFTMLEFYQAYATYEQLIDMTEVLLVELAQTVNGTLVAQWDEKQLDFTPPWRRLSVREAVVDLARVSEQVFEDLTVAAETASGVGVEGALILQALLEPLEEKDLQEVAKVAKAPSPQQLERAFANPSERPKLVEAIVQRYPSKEEQRVRAGQVAYFIFERIVEEQLVQPTFVTDFPLAVSPLARKKESDPALCDRFELFVAGTEIANAFSELNDPDDQRSRFQAQLRAKERGADETMDYDEDYCRALELGMPPTAGEGIGIDRLTMLLAGQASIRDVILFPLLRSE